MRASIIIFLAISALYVSARVIKRQKKITRVLKPACGCQQSVLEVPSTKSLLEAACSCLGTCGCPGGNDHIILEEPPCYVYNSDGYRIQNAEATCDRMAAIRQPKTIASIDVGIPVSANLALYQSDFPSCQCQNYKYIFDSPCSCRESNAIDVPSLRIPVETIVQTVIGEAPRAVVKIPSCGYQMPVECCQRQKCGCQLSAVDVPCSCQMPAVRSCGCTLSALDFPCGCHLPAFNLPCGCQLPGIDCGCQFQAYNSPCTCEMASGSCGCQLPVPNLPFAYQLSALDMPCGYQLDPCGYQVPCCNCQTVAPPAVGCSKYLRQITLPPPFL